uniref:Uncharacterized protein n=1 Tax=candidate division WOR-3 bacterium TaxID=2052148 RepID=A0A7C6EDC9_UNCW3
MFIIGGLGFALVFVTLGYFAFWTALRQGTEVTIAKFGKIIGIILFVITGLVSVFSFTGGPFIAHMMRSEMFPFPSRGVRRMELGRSTIEDIYNEIDELEDQVEDLEKRIDEMPVFIQDLVKQNIERMKK